MNILHLNTNYQVSSIYPNMFNEFNNLHNVSGRLYYPVVNKQLIDNINSEFVDVSPCLKRTDRMFFIKRNKKLFNDISKLYSIKDFDLSMAYSLFSNGFLAYTLFKEYGIPYFVIVQNTDINMYFKKMVHLRTIGRKIVKSAKKVIFISDSYKNHLLVNYFKKEESELIKKNSIVIPFGIDNYWFENIITNKNKAEQQIRLLYVGKINKNKNILSSIKACKTLIKQNKNVIFTIVGNIEDKSIAKKIMDNDFVNYMPFTQRDELLSVYRNNDIFIMPSFKESFGLVYAEAMSQGLPIIYTREQGFDKHFEDGTVGHSVDPTNINEIYNCIMKIYNNYKYYSKNCIEFVHKFKWESIMDKYILLFKKENILT